MYEHIVYLRIPSTSFTILYHCTLPKGSHCLCPCQLIHLPLSSSILSCTLTMYLYMQITLTRDKSISPRQSVFWVKKTNKKYGNHRLTKNYSVANTFTLFLVLSIFAPMQKKKKKTTKKSNNKKNNLERFQFYPPLLSLSLSLSLPPPPPPSTSIHKRDILIQG